MLDFFGKMIHGWRAGVDELFLNEGKFASVPATIELSSPAFANGEAIPKVYAAEGFDRSPPLNWAHIPPEAKELVLIVEDIDVPSAKPLVHLLVYGINPSTTGFADGALPSGDNPVQHPAYLLGRNSMNKQRWDGPAPIAGHGPHRYVFQLIALAETLLFDHVPDKKALVEGVYEKLVLATGSLTGTYER